MTAKSQRSRSNLDRFYAPSITLSSALFVINKLSSIKSLHHKTHKKNAFEAAAVSLALIKMLWVLFRGIPERSANDFSPLLRRSCVKAIKLILLHFSLCKQTGRSIICPGLSEEVSAAL